MAIEPMLPVLVGVGGTTEGLEAVDLAADEAAARMTPLVVLHVGTGCGPAEADLVDTAVARAMSEHPALAVAGEVAVGRVTDILLARACDACLLVLGSPRHATGHAGISTTAAVIERAGVPVVVHRHLAEQADARQPRPVLVGVDESESVVGLAFAEAAYRGAPLHAMHVWSGPGAGSGSLTRRQADELLADAVHRWADKYPEVPVETSVRQGLDATIVLVAGSRLAGLVVVGASRRGQRAGYASGTLPQTLARRAGCPVAVVPR
jgi:nucleotide-binding universal stress UspA family protein